MADQKIIITKGLPASGKSTWAKEQVKRAQGNAVRINKDDLRAMLTPGLAHSSDRERLILQVRDSLIMLFLKRGKTIYVDDTNLHPKHERRIRELAGDVRVEVKFFDVDVKTCIERNSKREGDARVPDVAIYGMAKDWETKWKHQDATDIRIKDTEIIDPIDGLPWAVISDMDGTLAIMCKRSPYEWKKCLNDTLNGTVASALEGYRARGYKIIIMSGRDSECRPETEMWLEANEVQYDELYMRGEGDNRKDNIVKRELFDNHIRGKYNIEVVFDDRNQVVDEWRLMGLTCFQVAEGNF